MKWNFCAFIVGPPEYGKTTIARGLVRRHLRELAGPVFAHDPDHLYRKDGCTFYPDAKAWRAAAAKAHRDKAMLPLGASVGGDAGDVTRLAMEMGARVNNAEDVRVPILVVYDEAVLVDSSGSTWMGKDDAKAIARRRHLGIGLVFNLQEATQLTKNFLRLGTDFYLFRQTSEEARDLDKKLKLERGTLERAGVTQLGVHQYVHARLCVGVVPEPL